VQLFINVIGKQMSFILRNADLSSINI